MLSQAVPPTQVVAAVSQVSVVLSHLRQGFSSSAFPKSAPKSGSPQTAVQGKAPSGTVQSQNGKVKSRRNSSKVSSKSKALSAVDFDTCVAQLLKDENLSKLLPWLTVTTESIQNSYWRESYVSSNSFFENKNGFPETALKGGFCVLGLDKRLPVQVPVFHQQKRFYSEVEGFGKNRSRGRNQQNKVSSSLDPKATQELADSIVEKVGDGQKYVKVVFSEEKKGTGPREALVSIGKTLAVVLVIYLILRGVDIRSSNEGGPSPMGLFETHDYEAENVTVTFADVRGVDEAKQELLEAVEFLKYPQKFQEIGAKLPKGVLLVGQPGIGKTLLAKAVAGEAGVPFFYASGAQFDDLYVGSGARKVRKLFAKAKMNSPCVIFIDEIDSAGAKRTNSTIHPYANQTINQLLSDMDGFHSSEGIIVIGATNKRENLDEALLRPGRFDVEVKVMPPDTKGREDIYNLYLEKVKCDPGLNIRRLAEASAGFTGADISNVVNQAALRAVIIGDTLVTWEHLDFAIDKLRMGPAWKNKKLKKEELIQTAYHEAGHTLAMLYTKDSPELNKVTILPRGRTLGHSSFLPKTDSYSQTKSEMIAHIDIAMGGRVAEELIYGQDKVTTGCSSDFQMATRYATTMVKQFGMSEKVGYRTHSDSGDVIRVNDTSPEYLKMIDSEIDRLLRESYNRVKSLLQSKNNELERLTAALMKYGTLEKEEVKKVIKGEKISRKPDEKLLDMKAAST